MRFSLVTLITCSILLFQRCTDSNGDEPQVDCSLSDLSITVDSSVEPVCNIQGSITVSATGGATPLSYSINGVDFQASTTFSGLAAGNYNIVVRDVDGCTQSRGFTLAAGPSGITLNVESGASECSQSTGSISAAASGGTGTFTYQLNGGSGQASGDFTSIAAGSYTVVVTDSDGCSAQREVVVESATSLSADIMPIVVSRCAISGCHNGSVSPNLTTSASVISNASRIRSETQSGSMPRNGTLPQSQIDLIACWVDGGANDN